MTATQGPDVSRQGVQRDLLPIVEARRSTPSTARSRPTISSSSLPGAFHTSKPSDLIPELQGRFPIRVELKALTQADFVRILTEPENALTKQYVALMDTEKVRIDFTGDAISALAEIAAQVNSRSENIGARRLIPFWNGYSRISLSMRPNIAAARFRSIPPTCISASTRSSGTKICRVIFCNAVQSEAGLLSNR